MPQEDLIITVFCLVADIYETSPDTNQFRSRGFAPALSDEGVITMEIIGEFMGSPGNPLLQFEKQVLIKS